MLLNRWPDTDSVLCVSGQVLREYLAVATRPSSCDCPSLLGSSLRSFNSIFEYG
jgi:hypothetical protein